MSVYGQEAWAAVQAMARSEFTPGETTKTLEITLVAKHSGVVRAKTETRTAERASYWDPKWFRPSPDPETGFTCTIALAENCLGEAEICAFNTDLDTGETTLVGATRELMRDANATFHGVVNG